MLKKILTFVSLTLVLVTVTSTVIKHSTGNDPVPMPIVRDEAFADQACGGLPIEQRDAQYRPWLAASVKINVRGASGSGTIVYFNPDDGYAYVQSCGHLWDGNMTAAQGLVKKLKCNVVTWYNNDKKLDHSKEYPAEVLYYSNDRTRDCSLLRFKPDWFPRYFPIAPANLEFKENMSLHSLGCDKGSEVAHYAVRYVAMRGGDLITTENSPRPGRSGGGLMTDTFYIGICWGTSDVSGGGIGYFTPLLTVREMNDKNGYGWLNAVGGSWARQIPIKDRNNPQKDYPIEYIPLPQ